MYLIFVFFYPWIEEFFPLWFDEENNTINSSWQSDGSEIKKTSYYLEVYYFWNQVRAESRKTKAGVDLTIICIIIANLIPNRFVLNLQIGCLKPAKYKDEDVLFLRSFK